MIAQHGNISSRAAVVAFIKLRRGIGWSAGINTDKVCRLQLVFALFELYPI